MDDDLQHILRAERRQTLLEPAAIYGGSLTHARARQHLMEGFNRRVLMLECSLRYIEDVAEQADGKPVSTFAVPELAIHVNSLWLNICGALDNLAWSVAYEFSVLPGVAEGPGEGRNTVGLERAKFLAGLDSLDAGFAHELRKFLPWQAELRDLRDPAAHRIPIYPIPGMLSGEAAAEAQRLYHQSDELMRNRRLSEGLAVIDQANALARYEPWITLSHDGRIEVRDLHKQMHSDEDQFTSLATIVLNRLFRDSSGYRAI